MKLIGAGLPRTGTLTQKVALEILGVGPCYHMVDVLGNLELVAQWRAALDGRGDWKTIFDGFDSTVDWPGGFFYQELIEVYPEAKVLLSVRDPAAWERSMRETVWAVYYGTSMICNLSRAAADVDVPWQDYMSLMTELLWEGRGTLRDGHEDREGMMAAFDRHTEEVKANVPADRLLVWDANEGWDPLCEFLEVDEPDIPLPHLNDSHTFKERVIDMTLTKLNSWWEQERAAQAATEAAGSR